MSPSTMTARGRRSPAQSSSILSSVRNEMVKSPCNAMLNDEPKGKKLNYFKGIFVILCSSFCLVECEKFEPDIVGVCPQGYPDECHEFCYKVSHITPDSEGECGKATWDEARQICEKLGGGVVSIRNEREQKCLEKYIAKSISGMWIGLYEEVDQLTNIGQWKWLDELVQYQGSYQNWGPGNKSSPRCFRSRIILSFKCENSARNSILWQN